MILVSACLLGENCRYDGRNCASPELAAALDGIDTLAVCPEVAGGLSVPRPPAEIQPSTGRVATKDGRDVTEAFLRGAEFCLELAREHEIRVAVMKSFSPSCGSGMVHDGSFSGRKREGMGVAAEVLSRNGVEVLDECAWIARRHSLDGNIDVHFPVAKQGG